MKCEKCGALITEGNKCQNCGYIVEKYNIKNKIIIPSIILLVSIIIIISLIYYNKNYIKGYIGEYECGEYEESETEDVSYTRNVLITEDKIKMTEDDTILEGTYTINNSYKVSNRIKEYFIDFELTKRIINGKQEPGTYRTEYFLENTKGKEYLLMDETISYKCIKK